VQNKYADILNNSQLLGAAEESKFNTYNYVFYLIVERTKITTLTVEINPFTLKITVLSEPETISLHDGYYPIKSDQKLTTVRNWLKENNPDLSNSVLVASYAKKFYFGTLMKLTFKVSTKYVVYVTYIDCATKEMKIYDTKELESYSNVAATAGPGSPADLQIDDLMKLGLRGFQRPTLTKPSTN